MNVPCPSCGTENAERARFCVVCGASLTIPCPVCGAPAVAGQRFCGDCGTPLGPASRVDSTAPATVERRLCSVLFCDLVGFTPLSESRDPEAVRELLSRYFDVARDVVGRYGGVVEKFIGDAVMAVWGTPVTTEDDAERSVRAALELVDRVAELGDSEGTPGLAARCGVVSGEVAVTLGAVGEGMVAGDAVNTAARVQTAADPGQVLVDESTARRARAAIELTEQPVRRLKGKAEPQRVWAATRVLAGVGGSQRVDGLEAPLIGRDVELRLLKDLFHAGIARSSPQLVLVTGAAGSGKSRLGWEFEKYIDGLAEAVLWHRGRCLSYGQGISYWALAEAVRQRAGIAEEDPHEVALPKLLAAVEQHVADQDERRFVGVRLARLLALEHPEDDGGRIEQADLFAGWRTFLVRLAEQEPTVWLIEDLQWADELLLAFVDHLLDWSRHVPLMLIGFARPEAVLDRPGWVTGRHRRQIALEALDDAEMRTLIDALVPDLHEDAARTIIDRAQGVPLFAIETVRALIDREVVVLRDGVHRLVQDLGELDVPDTLRALIAARLDLLDPDLRSIVSAASVLGDTFPAEAVASVTGQPIDVARNRLASLMSRDLFTVSADRLSPQRGSFAFSHELVRRVAFETLSRRDRKVLHLAVADHLRAAFAADGEEVSDAIARHLLDALDAVPGDSDVEELRGRAVAALERAATRARRTGAQSRAADAWAAAAERLPEDSPHAGRLWEDASEAATDAARFTDAVRFADRARTAHLARGDRRGAGRADALAGNALELGNEFALARPRFARALDALRYPTGLDTLGALSRLAGLETLAVTPEAEAISREALDLAESLGAPDRDFVPALIARGTWHSYAGHLVQSIAYTREAARRAERTGDDREIARAGANLASDLIVSDPAAAAAVARTGIEHGRRAGTRTFTALAVANLIEALLILGRWDEAAQVIEDGFELDHLEGIDYFLSGAGWLAAFRGDTAAAEASLAAIAAIGPDDPQMVCSMAAIRAAASRDPHERLRLATEAISFQESLGVDFESIRHCIELGARAAHELGELEQERDVLALLDARPSAKLSPMLRGQQLLIRARLADGGQEAAERFDEAVAAIRSISAPHELAHALVDRSRSRRAPPTTCC